MQKPVRYYIRTNGEQPVVQSVPVVRPHCATVPPVNHEADAAVPLAVTLDRRPIGVARLRDAIRRGTQR